MTGKKKRVDFSVRPRTVKEELPSNADQWVREGKGANEKPQKVDEGPQKRLTLNLPTELHTAFKAKCVIKGVTIQDRVRLLIERDLAAEQPPAAESIRPT
jgi:hypothetical protein